VIVSLLATLAALSGLQIARKQQRTPVWTQKANILVTTSAIATLIITLILVIQFPSLSPSRLPTVALQSEGGSPNWILFLPLLPLFQPFILFLVWLIFLPLDHYLKNRVMTEAKNIRKRNPNLVVIGVTGSVGKTTTKELLGHVLSSFSPLITPAHVNTEMGVAQWMIRELPRYTATRAEKGILVVEMGAYKKGEISLMSSFVQQTIGVVTYVGTQHLALFGSEENLLQAKAEIVTNLPKNGHAFMNGDCQPCLRIKEMSPCPVTVVGTGSTVNLRALDTQETSKGVTFSIGTTTFQTPLHGTHNIANILLAVAVARHLGMTDLEIAAKLRSFEPPENTFSVRDEKNVKILDDTHNSSETSLRAAIEWARTQPERPKVLLLSGLIELGAAQERIEKEVGTLASQVFDTTVFVQKRAAGAFPSTFKKPVLSLQEASRLEKGSLLVAVGKMPQQCIAKLLPRS
jgi:UDP-N-acetylmuramoyl-tripeptide--D-alanyl-D-alanine ligase